MKQNEEHKCFIADESTGMMAELKYCNIQDINVENRDASLKGGMENESHPTLENLPFHRAKMVVQFTSAG